MEGETGWDLSRCREGFELSVHLRFITPPRCESESRQLVPSIHSHYFFVNKIPTVVNIKRWQILIFISIIGNIS